MAYSFNPTSSEANLLAQIAARESGGNYTATVSPAACAAMGQSVCTASGAYQFIDSTWQYAASQTGVGTQYASAADAPAWMQDTNALWLLRAYGPNSTTSWAASGPYIDTSGVSAGIPGSFTQPMIDVIGAGASASTGDILTSLESSLTTGFDLTDPTIWIPLLAASGLALYLITSR